MSQPIYFTLSDSCQNILTGSKVSLRPLRPPYFSGNTGTQGVPIVQYADVTGSVYFNNVVDGLYELSYTPAGAQQMAFSGSSYSSYINTVVYLNIYDINTGSYVNGFLFGVPNTIQTSSFSSSYALFATSASYAQFSTTSSFAQNFNPNASASYALQALTASYALNGNSQTTGSSVTSSYVSGSNSIIARLTGSSITASGNVHVGELVVGNPGQQNTGNGIITQQDISVSPNPNVNGTNAHVYVLDGNHFFSARSGTGVLISSNPLNSDNITLGWDLDNTQGLSDIAMTLNYNNGDTSLVGINNTNPQYALDVIDNINFTGQLLQNGSVYVPPTSSYSHTASFAAVTNQAKTASLLSTPNGSTVVGSISNNLLVTTPGELIVSTGGGAGILNMNTDSQGSFDISSANYTPFLSWADNSGSGVFTVGDVGMLNNNTILTVSDANQMVTSNVPLGIGKNPNHSLDVAGDINFATNLLQNGNPYYPASASFASSSISSSHSVTSSYSITASFAPTSLSSSHALTASYSLNAAGAIVSSSWASASLSSSYAATSSLAINAQSASYSPIQLPDIIDVAGASINMGVGLIITASNSNNLGLTILNSGNDSPGLTYGNSVMTFTGLLNQIIVSGSNSTINMPGGATSVIAKNFVGSASYALSASNQLPDITDMVGQAVNIGVNLGVTSSITATKNLIVGPSAFIAPNVSSSIALGDSANVGSNANWGVAIGFNADSTNRSAYALGEDALATGQMSYVLGAGGQTNGFGSFAFGRGATTNNSFSMVIAPSDIVTANDSLPGQFVANFPNGYVLKGGQISGSSITASLLGTASFALNIGTQVSASYAISSSFTSQYPDITDNISSHQVGINQSDPQYTLDVNGETNLNGNVIFQETFVWSAGDNQLAYGDVDNNLFFGLNAGFNFGSPSPGTASNNTIIGANVLNDQSVFNNVTALGANSLMSGSGNDTIAIGYNAGTATGGVGSGSIYLGSTGSAAENAIVRIGTNQTNTYLAGKVHASGFSGSLFGTASVALNAVSSSNSLSSSNALTASFVNSNYVQVYYDNDSSQFYGLSIVGTLGNEQIQINQTNYNSQSGLFSNISSSYATTANTSVTSSYSIVAATSISSSWASQSLSGSFATSTLNATSASHSITSSYSVASTNATTSSYSSQGLSASFAQQSISASYAPFNPNRQNVLMFPDSGSSLLSGSLNFTPYYVSLYCLCVQNDANTGYNSGSVIDVDSVINPYSTQADGNAIGFYISGSKIYVPLGQPLLGTETNWLFLDASGGNGSTPTSWGHFIFQARCEQ